MKVKFSPNTKDDFRNYEEYLKDLKSSDTKKYSHLSPSKENKKLRDNINNSIGNKSNHSDSIFPKEFEYNSDSHKMYVDKKSHHIVFYKVINPKKGKKHLQMYIDEFVFRYNTRKVKDSERFDILLSNMTNRLRYKDLIN